MEAWEPLSIDDPEPERVLERWGAVEPGLSERRAFRIPADFDFYGAANRDLIVGLNRWMLGVFRELTPPGGFLHVVDPDLNHIGYRFHPHVPFERDATPEQWWGFVPYLPNAVWRVPVLPDGDSSCFVSPRFDFAVLSVYGVTEPSELVFVGAPLVRALQRETPELLARWAR